MLARSFTLFFSLGPQSTATKILLGIADMYLSKNPIRYKTKFNWGREPIIKQVNYIGFSQRHLPSYPQFFDPMEILQDLLSKALSDMMDYSQYQRLSDEERNKIRELIITGLYNRFHSGIVHSARLISQTGKPYYEEISINSEINYDFNFSSFALIFPGPFLFDTELNKEIYFALVNHFPKILSKSAESYVKANMTPNEEYKNYLEILNQNRQSEDSFVSSLPEEHVEMIAKFAAYGGKK